jgi:pantothenate kinase type III
MSGRALICADIGNSRTKVAVAGRAAGQWKLNQSVASPELLDLGQIPVADWLLISVNQTRLSQLRQWIADQRAEDHVRLLGYRDFPIELRVDFPEKLGIDRIAAAVGARELAEHARQPFFIVGSDARDPQEISGTTPRRQSRGRAAGIDYRWRGWAAGEDV